MLYLRRFTFPSQERESFFFHGPQRQCYNTNYPFGVIARFDPTVLEFEPVTILYGGNGCGKTTALNVIAEKLGLQRDARYNRSSFFEDYVRLCEASSTDSPQPPSRGGASGHARWPRAPLVSLRVTCYNKESLPKGVCPMQTRIRTLLDTIHGSKWARIIPLCLMGLIYVVSMILWHPASAVEWIKPLFLNALAAGGVYFVSRFSSGTRRFNDACALISTFFFVIATVMIFTTSPSVFQEEYNPGLGVGPAAFLGISLYHRYRMKKGC